MELEVETGAILKCAFEVHNALGAGFREKAYENAMVGELQRQGISFSQQARYPILYHGVKVDEFIPDLVVFDSVIVDTKVVDGIGAYEMGQMLNYLKVCNMQVGLLLNFKQARVEYKRVVL